MDLKSKNLLYSFKIKNNLFFENFIHILDHINPHFLTSNFPQDLNISPCNFMFCCNCFIKKLFTQYNLIIFVPSHLFSYPTRLLPSQLLHMFSHLHAHSLLLPFQKKKNKLKFIERKTNIWVF